jgi:hypothetical protein
MGLEGADDGVGEPAEGEGAPDLDLVVADAEEEVHEGREEYGDRAVGLLDLVEVGPGLVMEATPWAGVAGGGATAAGGLADVGQGGVVHETEGGVDSREGLATRTIRLDERTQRWTVRHGKPPFQVDCGLRIAD